MQVNFKLHEHVVCSPFESRAYFIITFKTWNLTYCLASFARESMIFKAAKFLVKRLSIINVYLRVKQQFSPLYSHQKFPRSGQKFRERSQAID